MPVYRIDSDGTDFNGVLDIECIVMYMYVGQLDDNPPHL